MRQGEPNPISISRHKAPRLPARLRPMLSLADFERRAARHLPKSIFGYVSGGVQDDLSLNENIAAFRRITLRPRILRNVAQRSLETTLFGQTLGLPFGIAPMGFSALAAYDGDVVLGRAAQAAGSIAICSAASLTPLERVAAEAESRWFQAYIPGDRARISGLLDRLRRAGFDHLVVTGDVPVAGNRENNARNGFDAPLRFTPRLIWQGVTHPRWVLGTLGREMSRRGMPHFENMESVQGPPLFSRDLVRSKIGREELDWDDLRFIRDIWPGRLVVKGVLHPDDARLAQDCGCDGIIVSNHGGRQLDGAITAIDALPGIRAAVPGMTVMLDGGIRRGSDVLKAMMLGADFTFVGRPFLFAAACFGEAGVAHAFALLRDEIDRDMALLGITSPMQMREVAGAG